MEAKITDRDLVFTGPEAIAGKFMRMFWQPVFRSEDLPAGQARPVRIMSEDFTLYRGKSGKAHAVGNRCAHRHVQLSTGFVEDDCIRCLYHGWKFDGEGVCVELPGGTVKGRPKLIRSYPIEEYLGLVFVYFGEGEPPPLPRYPKLEAEGVLDVSFDVFPVQLLLLARKRCVLHLPFTHRDLMAGRGLSRHSRSLGQARDRIGASPATRNGRDAIMLASTTRACRMLDTSFRRRSSRQKAPSMPCMCPGACRSTTIITRRSAPT